MIPKIQVKKNKIKNYQAGYPLLRQEWLAISKAELNRLTEGQIVHLSNDGRLLASAYIGFSNKGMGYLFSEWEETLNPKFLIDLFQRALNQRQDFYQNPDINGFRVFNGAADGLGGIAIDYYDSVYLIHWYSQGIYQYQSVIVSSLASVIGSIEPEFSIYQKRRFDNAGGYLRGDDYVAGRRREEAIMITEYGAKFPVYVNDGAMVGIFIDQRQVRRRVTELAKGRTVLNTFSYTGAFSVAAVLGGAVKTTSVDVAKRSVDKTRQAFQANQIDSQSQDIVVMDVFDYFKYAKRTKRGYDLVIVDPPSFARTKKNSFRAKTDYAKLLIQVLAVTNPNGIIVASTNCGLLSRHKFLQDIDQAFSQVKRQYRIIEQYQLPPDFKQLEAYPEADYLKVEIIQCD